MILEVAAYIYFCGIGGDTQSVGHVEVLFSFLYQPHISIYTSHECEVGRDWWHCFIKIAYLYPNLVESVLDVWSYIKCKCRVAALVLTHIDIVEPYVSHLEGSVETYVLALAILFQEYGTLVGERSFAIVFHGVCVGIPCVWNVYGLTFESPTVVDSLL